MIHGFIATVVAKKLTKLSAAIQVREREAKLR